MAYRLECLGRLLLLHEGRPLPAFAGHRQKLAFLAVLATDPEQRVARDRLLGLFWPERDEGSARHSLSQLLYELRSELGDALDADRGSVRLRPDSWTCDVREFREAVEAGAWERAAELYRGHFLEGVQLSGPAGLEHWADGERGELRRLHRQAMRALLARARAAADARAAAEWARRWLAVDPHEDEAHHVLVEALLSSGNRIAALEVYGRYERLCREELEVEPLDETRALVDAVRAGAPPPAMAPAEAAAGETSRAGAATSPAARSGPAAADLAASPAPSPAAGARAGGAPATLEPAAAPPAPAPLPSGPPAVGAPARRPAPEPAGHVPYGVRALLAELRRRRMFEVGFLAMAAVVLGMRAFERVEPAGGWPVPVRMLGYGALALLPAAALLLAWWSLGPREGRAADRGAPHLRVRAPALLGSLGALALGFLAVALFVPPRLPPERHVAVLPFRVIGDAPEAEAFADGLAEMLSSQLTRVQRPGASAWVVPAAEIRARGIRQPSEARRALGVTLAVTGSVQWAEDRVRVTLNLVDADRLRQVGSVVVDATERDLTPLEDEIVPALARALELELGPRARAALAAGSTRDGAAYRAFLEGRGHLARYEQEPEVDRAIERFRAATERDPAFARAHAALGEAYLRKFELSRDAAHLGAAREAVVRALAIDDELADVRAVLGRVYAATGRHDLAVAEFRHALALEAAHPEALAGLAAAYTALGRLEEAEATYRRAIEQRPTFWGGYNELGKFYYRRGRYADALDAFTRVVELTPDNARGYSNLGVVYYVLERFEDAAAMFRKAIELAPDVADYSSNLATMYFFLGRYADAARTLERAVALDDRSYELWRNLGSAYYWAPGERAKARAAYARAAALLEEHVALNPEDPRLLVLLADAYAMLGRGDEARRLATQALEGAGADPQIWFVAASLHEHLGDRDRALAYLRRALDAGYPRHEVERAPTLERLRQDPRYRAAWEEGR